MKLDEKRLGNLYTVRFLPYHRPRTEKTIELIAISRVDAINKVLEIEQYHLKKIIRVGRI